MAARTLSGAWRRICRRGKIQKRPVLRPVAALEQRAGRTARQQAPGRTALLAGASSRAWGARQHRSSARYARRRLQQHGRCGGAGGAGSSASEAKYFPPYVVSKTSGVISDPCPAVGEQRTTTQRFYEYYNSGGGSYWPG